MSVGLAAAAPASASNLITQPYAGQANLAPAGQPPGAGYGGPDQVWQSNGPSQPYALAAAPVPTPKHQHKSHALLYSAIALTTAAAAALALWLLFRKGGAKASTKTENDKNTAAEAAKKRVEAQANQLKAGIKEGAAAAEKAAKVEAPKTTEKAPETETEPKSAPKTEESKPVEEGAKPAVAPKASWIRSPYMWRIGAPIVALSLVGLGLHKTGHLQFIEEPIMKFAGPSVKSAGATMYSGGAQTLKWMSENGQSLKMFALEKIAKISLTGRGANKTIALPLASPKAASSNATSSSDERMKGWKKLNYSHGRV